MAKIIGISIPEGYKLLDQLKEKYHGGTSTSKITRDAYKVLMEKLSVGGAVIPLPNWRAFDSFLTTCDDSTFTETKKLVKQFSNILEAKEPWRKLRRKLE